MTFIKCVFNIYFTKVQNTHRSNDGLLRDFCDSEDFQSHGLFGHDPHALILHCYYDDFQVTNPLGSKTKRHKIGTLLNLALLSLSMIYR